MWLVFVEEEEWMATFLKHWHLQVKLKLDEPILRLSKNERRNKIKSIEDEDPESLQID